MLFRAPGSLTGSTEMDVDMSGAILPGILQFLMSLQSLVQIAGLSDVKRNPLPIFGLSAIDVISRHRRELRIKVINGIWILGSRLAGPIDQKCRSGLRLVATTQ
jgi:hypothetical protein